jgi:hypothetical protein
MKATALVLMAMMMLLTWGVKLTISLSVNPVTMLKRVIS